MKLKNRKALKFLIAVVLLTPLLVGFIYGKEPPIEQKIKNAIYYPKTCYSGIETIIFWSAKGKSQASEAKVYFKPPDKTRIEYRAPQSLNKIIVIDNEEFEYLYSTSKNVALKSLSSNNRILNIDILFNMLKKNYDFIPSGTEKIAGRPTDVITIKPKNKENPYRKVWIDKEYQIILQTKTLQPKGNLSQVSNFTVIDFPKELSDKLFSIPTGVKTITKSSNVNSFSDVKTLNRNVKFKLLLPSYIPEGYVFDTANLVRHKNSEFVRIQYTDGLSIISLFETIASIDFKDYEFFEETADLSKISKIKSLNLSKARVLHKKHKGINCVLLGSISKETLVEIMNSVK